jgi:hypothetical protein
LKALLPFIVHCRYQPIGGRGAPKTGYVTFEREFDIHEVATDEAPIVAEALNPDDTVVGRYRIHAGHFYTQTSKKTDQDDVLDTISVENLVGWKDAIGTDHLYPFADIFSHVTTRYEDGNGHWYSFQAYDLLGANHYPNERTIKEFYEAGDEITRQHGVAVQSYQRRGLIIDGAMWFQIDEPRLVCNLDKVSPDFPILSIDIYTEEQRPDRRTDYHRTQPYLGPFDAPAFRLDRLDDFKAYLTERTGIDATRFYGLGNNVNLLMPDALRFDDETDNLFRATRSILELTQPDMLDGSFALNGGWVDLQQRMLRAKLDKSEVVLEQMATSLDAFSSITDNNQARLQAKDALGRWDLRVMNPDSSYGKLI